MRKIIFILLIAMLMLAGCAHLGLDNYEMGKPHDHTYTRTDDLYGVGGGVEIRW